MGPMFKIWRQTIKNRTNVQDMDPKSQKPTNLQDKISKNQTTPESSGMGTNSFVSGRVRSAPPPPALTLLPLTEVSHHSKQLLSMYGPCLSARVVFRADRSTDRPVWRWPSILAKVQNMLGRDPSASVGGVETRRAEIGLLKRISRACICGPSKGAYIHISIYNISIGSLGEPLSTFENRL